jgi:hypothetical protein
MYRQAQKIAELLDRPETIKELDRLFRPDAPPTQS